jgi:hypothetical protein
MIAIYYWIERSNVTFLHNYCQLTIYKQNKLLLNSEVAEVLNSAVGVSSSSVCSWVFVFSCFIWCVLCCGSWLRLYWYCPTARMPAVWCCLPACLSDCQTVRLSDCLPANPTDCQTAQPDCQAASCRVVRLPARQTGCLAVRLSDAGSCCTPERAP